MLQINEHDLKITLADLIQAAKNGEEILIVTDKKTFKIVEVETPKRLRKAGSAKGKIEIAADFDEPLEDFKEYI